MAVSPGNDRIFQETWEAARLLEEAIRCTKCNQPSDELQYLGTVCKHVFCWTCIKKIEKIHFPQCDLCGFPLESAKPTPARLMNDLFKGIGQMTDLLNQFEVAAVAEGKNVDTVAKQRIAGRALSPPRRSVAEFLATQTHIEDDEFVRNSPLKNHLTGRQGSRTPTGRTPSTARQSAKKANSSSKKAPKNKRQKTESPPSSISIELNDYEDENGAGEKNLFGKKEPKMEITTPVLPKWDEKPLATSTQIPTLFMTQQMTQKEEPKTPLTHQVSVPRVPTGRSYEFEFAKKPATVFGAKESKNDKVFNSAGPPKQKEKWDRREAGQSPAVLPKNEFITPERASVEPHFDVNLHTLERDAPRKSLIHRRGDMKVIGAVSDGDLERLHSLIAADADLNERDPEMGTPLFIAAKNGQLEICKMLVEHGAIINASCGNECNTALHIAVKNEFPEVAEYLMSKGASRSQKNIRSLTPAQMAETQSPMRKLVEKYKKHPRQPAIPPRLPSHIVVCIDEAAQKALTNEMVDRARKYLEVESELTSDTTHFVAVVDSEGIANGGNQKLITAMLRGLKVVTLNYVEDCIKISEVIRDWHPYEVSRIRFREHPVAEGSVARCRRAKERFEPGLFKGCKFYIFSQRFSTYGRRPFLSNIIMLAEGEVLNREPAIDENDPLPFHKQDLISPYFILYEQGAKVPPKLLDEDRYQKVTPGWLFETITRYEFLPPY